jgi:8-amino-3,8-dideoxy-alpha-D-manno-octulosonate transaminase
MLTLRRDDYRLRQSGGTMPGFELIGAEEMEAIREIFTQSGGVLFAHGFDTRRRGRYRVRELERALARRLGVPHCQAVTSGTAAQLVALRALGIGPGDEVITQAFTFVATVEAILACGATPIVVDVDETLNMSPGALETAMTPRTRCVVPVHMLGNPADLAPILAIAARHGTPVLEDACEALGATYRGRAVGAWGKAGFFSLDFGKVITCGEGGFIVSADPDLHHRIAAYHDHGHENDPALPRGRDRADRSGFNFRMTEMQAAVALVQLGRLDYILKRNRQHKARLKTALSGLSGLTFRRITDPEGDLADTLMFFLPTAGQATHVVEEIGRAGVGTKNVPDAMLWHFARHWGHIWRSQDGYHETYQEAWPASSSLLERCVALPIMVQWTEQDLDRLADAVTRAVRSCT